MLLTLASHFRPSFTPDDNKVLLAFSFGHTFDHCFILHYKNQTLICIGEKNDRTRKHVCVWLFVHHFFSTCIICCITCVWSDPIWSHHTFIHSFHSLSAIVWPTTSSANIQYYRYILVNIFYFLHNYHHLFFFHSPSPSWTVHYCNVQLKTLRH